MMASDPYRILLLVLAMAACIAALLPVALTYRQYGSNPWFWGMAVAPAIVLLGIGLQKLVIDHLWWRLFQSSTGRRFEPWERVAIAVLMSALVSLVTWLIVRFLAGDSLRPSPW
jgi:hypothetical protein